MAAGKRRAPAAKRRPVSKASPRKGTRRSAPAAAAKAKSARPKPAKAAAKRRQIPRRQPETLRLRYVSPSLTVDDIERSLEFYTQALGFLVSERMEEGGKLVGVMIKAGTVELGISQDDWKKGRGRTKGEGIRLWCEVTQDLDALAQRIRAHGVKLATEPEDKPWGIRSFYVDDPDGYHYGFFRKLKPR